MPWPSSLMAPLPATQSNRPSLTPNSSIDEWSRSISTLFLRRSSEIANALLWSSFAPSEICFRAVAVTERICLSCVSKVVANLTGPREGAISLRHRGSGQSVSVPSFLADYADRRQIDKVVCPTFSYFDDTSRWYGSLTERREERKLWKVPGLGSELADQLVVALASFTYLVAIDHQHMSSPLHQSVREN